MYDNDKDGEIVLAFLRQALEAGFTPDNERMATDAGVSPEEAKVILERVKKALQINEKDGRPILGDITKEGGNKQKVVVFEDDKGGEE
jgi:hypothetical protein